MDEPFRKNRDITISEIVRGLLLSEVAFQEVFKKYKAGSLRFSDIADWVDDKGQSLLYNIKEKCHSFFRQMEKGMSRRNEWLLDLAIGSIFHEAMKLRESIYQIGIYRPMYLEYKLQAEESSYEKEYLQQFERIISRAEEGVVEGMKETRSLFHYAMAQLLDLLRENSGNRFLVRFLLENEKLLKKVYGPQRAKEIFHVMYKDGLSEAYRLVGRGYLESEHYDLASRYFSKAMKMGPSKEVQSLVNFSLGMNAYYRNTYSRALFYLSKLVRNRSTGKVDKEYLKKAEAVCHHIFYELKEGRGTKVAWKARSLAERIRKCYSESKRSL